jgi:hypothetical protein
VGPPPEETWVRDRTFWVVWDQVLDTQVFSDLVCLFKRQAAHLNNYTVRVGIANQQLREAKHPLGDTAVGYHVDLRGGDSVGGYQRTDQKRYVLITDEKLHQDARRYYELGKSCSFVFESTFEGINCRSELNRICNIGTYKSDWERPVAERSGEYFEKYDVNIKTWITKRWYHALTRLCARKVIAELLRRHRMQPKLLEVGYGTGAMSRIILEWIATMNELAEMHYTEPYVDTFHGLDAAEEMRRRTSINLHDYSKWSQFSEGVFDEKLNIDHLIGAGNKLDILCGSLVLHDLLQGDTAKTVPLQMKTLDRLVRHDGVVLFADIFEPDDADAWKYEIKCWTEGMRAEGMTDEQISTFMELNPEMRHPVKESELIKCALEYGFSAEIIPISQPGSSRSPFKVLQLSRDPNLTKHITASLV